MNLEIRLAEKDDSIKITQLWEKLACIHILADEFDNVKDLEFQHEMEKFFIDEIESSNCIVLVATVDENIVAFMDSEFFESDQRFSAGDYYYINNLFSEPEYRKKFLSVSCSLFKRMEQEIKLRNVDYILCDFFDHNKKITKVAISTNFIPIKTLYAKKIENKSK